MPDVSFWGAANAPNRDGQMNSTDSSYNLTRDPIFLITAAFFAILTTAMPAFMGQVRTMPLLQTAALVVFLAISLRKGGIGAALMLMAIWLVVQIALLALMADLFMDQVERSIPAGFDLRTGLAAWLYAGAPLPNGPASAPVARLVEIASITAGTLITGGLLGVWFLMKATNQAGFSLGVFLSGLPQGGTLPFTFLLWTGLRLAGYASLVALLAEPLWTQNWSFNFYVKQRGRFFLIAIALVLAGLILEILLS